MLKKQSGLTIVELLIGLAIGLVITGVVLSVFTTSLINSQGVIQNGKLNDDLNAVMDIIVSDVQRAGYSNATPSKTGNPFMQAGTDISVSNGNCILFTYDRNSNGTVEDNEKFGYRLSGNAIQDRPVGAAFNCGAPISAWENLTDPNVIIITAFTVSLSNVAIKVGAGTDTINYRTVSLSITGHLTTDNTVTKTITRTIKVYNSRYAP